MTPTWAVVPSAGRDYLRDCLESLLHQVDGIILVANGQLRGTLHPDTAVTRVDDPGTDRNISRWWNLGIDRAARLARLAGADQWNTLVVNDDVIAPPDLAHRLSTAMRGIGAALAYPNQHDSHETVWHRPEPVNLHHRITGYAFMLRGEDRLRLDESLAWWYGDDDLDWRARQQGGAVLVAGCAVEHQAPNGYTAAHRELQDQAAADRTTFKAKWGRTPW